MSLSPGVCGGLQPVKTSDGAKGTRVEMSALGNLSLGVLVFFYSLNVAPMMFETFTSDRT